MKIRVPLLSQLLVVASVCVASACSDSTGSSGSTNESQYRVLIYDETSMLIYAELFPNGQVSGQVMLPAGEQRHLIVRLGFADNTTFPVLADGDEIRVITGDASIATFQPDHRWEVYEHGTINGLKQGATTVRVQYVHAGKTVYTSQTAPVAVR